MAISEDQLQTWSHQGSIVQSSTTYNAIKGALEDKRASYANKNYQVFLQGSYGNDTNIWTESDVDVVIVLNECWQSDLDALSPYERAAYGHSFPDAVYGYQEFKRDGFNTLVAAYGNDVKVGGKAISIAARGNRRKADVIAAIRYRRYSRFLDVQNQQYAEGICFWNSAGQRIANFPYQHSVNLTAKHQNTYSKLKPLIRVFKNIRTKLIEHGYIGRGTAPSYYLEGLLYNVPNERFAGSYQQCVTSILEWIRDLAVPSTLVTANHEFYLVADGSRTSWSTADYTAFVDGALRFWDGRRPWIRLNRPGFIGGSQS